MKKAFKFLALIRIQNLLFVAFIQFLMRQAVIIPLMETSSVFLYSSWTDFSFLLISTIFIAAGGYVINDYYDIKIDKLNKPSKIIVGEYFSKATAMRIYQILTVCGLITGLLLAWRIKNTSLAFIFVIIVGILWFYSASYKRQFLVGNLIVAFLAAITVLMPALIEVFHFNHNNAPTINPYLIRNILIWTGGFAIFSFLLTLIREIIKDMEDEYGDRESECRTLPIVWGFTISKTIVIVLVIITIGCLLFANHFIRFENTLTLRYILFGLILPLTFSIYLIIKAKRKNDYKQISSFIKFIMLIGVLYAPIFHYLMSLKTGIRFFNFF